MNDFTGNTFICFVLFDYIFFIILSPLFQIGGVRFLYDNLIESVSRFKSSPGFGCILAHSMGLGKTIQMIALIDVLLRHTSAKSVLLIVPINTLQNWMSEINMWCPESVPEGYPDVQLRNFKTYILNDNFKTPYSRAKVIGNFKVHNFIKFCYVSLIFRFLCIHHNPYMKQNM